MRLDVEKIRTAQDLASKSLQELQSDIAEFIESHERIGRLIATSLDEGRQCEQIVYAYDEFLTALSVVVNVTRKCSIQLELNNLEKNGKLPWTKKTKCVTEQTMTGNEDEPTQMLEAEETAETHQFSGLIINNNYTINSGNIEVSNNQLLIAGDSTRLKSNANVHKANLPSQGKDQLDEKYDKLFQTVLKPDYKEKPTPVDIHDGTLSRLEQLTLQNTEPKTTYENPFLSASSSMMSDDDSFGALDDFNLLIQQKFNFKRKSLEDYQPKSIRELRIAFIENLDMLQFYAIDPFDKDTIDVLRAPYIGEYDDEMPAENEVFVVLLDSLPYRAITDKSNSENVLLLDIGETVQLEEDAVLLKIPKKYRQKPAQAIPCILQGLYNQTITNSTHLKELLTENLHGQVKFYVKQRHFDYLELQYIGNNEELTLQKQNTKPIESKAAYSEELDTEPIDENESPQASTARKEFNINDLTPEELAILNEEPLNTTNAMIAVMGYDPQDEKRICAHYNPKTGGCFKGANCQLLHVSRERNGWTKDVVVANCISFNDIPTVVYTKGQELTITPTHIVDCARFYAQVVDDNAPSKPLIWTTDEIPKTRLLQRNPLKYDMVMARFSDGLWYRAQIQDITETGQLFKVLYLDYGNELLVSLCDLARFDMSTSMIPPQAKLFKIAGVRDITTTVELRRAGLQFLSQKILNQNIRIRILQQIDDDIFIGFIGTTSNLKSSLIKNGFLESSPTVFR